MIGKYDRNVAEQIFYRNVGTHIKAELINGEIFEGKLLSISHNILIIRNRYGVNEMFRYEDLKYLQNTREKRSANLDEISKKIKQMPSESFVGTYGNHELVEAIKDACCEVIESYK